MHDRRAPSNGLPAARHLDVAPQEITCQQFVELITDYLDGTLPIPTRSHVEEHLVMCDWCVAYQDQMEATIASLGALAEPEPTAPSAALLSTLRTKQETRR